MEPHRLTDEQRETLLSALEEANIGDPDSRDLFASALEYDLARFCELTSEEPAPEVRKPKLSAADTALRGLAKSARALAERLSQLDEASRGTLQGALTQTDRFHRGYGNEYLDCVREELLRIAAAGSARDRAARPEKPKAAPVSEAARQFLRRVADAYADCFEMRPTTDRRGLFVLVLKAIVKATAIRLPTDAHALKDALKSD
ncbi:MAG: hypothetical protein WCA32_14300 [Chromatiaceae bacterium]